MHLTYASGPSMPHQQKIYYENEGFINNSNIGDLGMNTEKANMVSNINNQYSTNAQMSTNATYSIPHADLSVP